ncbi:hypothetical protein BDQ17DRAFT_1340591 [Cyathus striatus]|nr:hypothetical protein BDQ17DRAFT_1340591 [Cyathus striatus]
MVSVLSQSAFVIGTAQQTSKLQISELGNLDDAVDSFKKLIIHSGRVSVRLHCTIPTWSATSETCLDLHDLNELRSRFLLFIHDLRQSLRASGIAASYSLIPSNSSVCLVCAVPPNAGASAVNSSDIEQLKVARTNKRSVSLRLSKDDDVLF